MLKNNQLDENTQKISNKPVIVEIEWTKKQEGWKGVEREGGDRDKLEWLRR